MVLERRQEVEVRSARSADDVGAVRALFGEYEQWLAAVGHGHDLSDESARLPGDYARPSGELLIAVLQGEVTGCIALRRLDGSAAELKRFYVRPSFRGAGVGGRLLEAAIESARDLGCLVVRLDSLETEMAAATALYRAAGFREIPPYHESEPTGKIFLELRLRGGVSRPEA